MTNPKEGLLDMGQPHRFAGPEAYRSKASTYFSGARSDYVEELPRNPSAKILEVGCGSGATGSLALSEGRCGTYCGVEMSQNAAEAAREKLTEVLLGDIERLDPPWHPETFDALILSEVLEHLADPWTTLRKLRPKLRSGGLVFASSPNISHYRVIAMLFCGEWRLTDFGVMDRTHLRWFTPTSYRRLFQSCGFLVDSVREVRPLTAKARFANVLTGGRFRHLFMTQVDLRAHRA